MLRIATLASAAALTLAAPAFAQPADTGAWNWTGPYVGVNAGYGGGQFTYPFSGTTDPAGNHSFVGQAKQSSSGPLGGVQAGHNIQGYRGLLLGLETDIDATNIRGDSRIYGSDSEGNNAAANAESRIEYLGTVRGRIGQPMFDDRFVPYVTGGFAYAGVKNRADFGCSACSNGGFAANTRTQTGWTVGGGAEYALDRRLSFKVEYLYADLGHETLTNDGAAPNVGLYNAAVTEKADANLVRAGINFRF